MFVISMGVVMIDPGLIFGDERRLLASNIKETTYQINRSGMDYYVLVQGLGVAWILIEITGWIMFYLSKKDAI